MTAIKLGIGIPAYGGNIVSHQARMWSQLGAALVANEDQIQIHGFAEIDMNGIDNARNALRGAMRFRGLDWLLMIDADTWCDPGSHLIRMIVEAHAYEACAVIGVPVVTRGVMNPINVYRYETIEQADGHRRVKAAPIPRESIPRGELFEVDAIGGAIMAINLKTVGDIEFQFTRREEDGRVIRSSEDHEFCRQVRERGLKVLADGRIRSCHVNKPDILVWDPNR